MKNYEIKTPKKQILFIICIAIGSFMTNLDMTIINTALPAIAKDLAVTPSTVVLILLVYQVTETSFLLIFGKLGDIKGFKMIYVSGFMLFTIGSLFCGLSQNIESLLLFRAVQGLGGAMLFSIMMAAVTAFLPTNLRGKGIGIVTMTAGFGVALGPAIGGFIASLFNWKWIFFVNIPIGIFAVILSVFAIPSKQAKSIEKLDWISAIISVLMLSFFIFAFNAEHRHGLKSPVVIVPLILATVFFVVFIINEKKSKYPLLSHRLFKNKNYTLSALALVPSFMVVGGILFILPFFFEIAKGMGTEKSGLILMIFAIGHLAGPYSGHITDRLGAKSALLLGMLGVTAGFAGLYFVGLNTGVFSIILILFIFGLMLGFEKAPNVHLAMSFVPQEKKGTGAGTLGVLRSLGILFGILTFEKIFSVFIHSVINVNPHNLTFAGITPDIAARGFHYTMVWGLILSIVAIILIIPVTVRNKKN